MKSRVFAASLAAAAALACPGALAGMYDKPWALAETGNPSSSRDEARVAVTKIDGKSVRSTRKGDPIEPGRHKVTLHFESARGVFRPEYKEVEIDFEPCTRYLFVAHVPTPTGPDWTARSYTEPIGECRAKFMKGAPAK
jgi:hypothetical protein